MATLAAVGYYLAAALFVLFGALQGAWMRRHTLSQLLFLAALASAVWAGVSGRVAGTGYSESISLVAVELIRDVAWLVFLYALLRYTTHMSPMQRVLRWGMAMVLLVALAIGVLLGIAYFTNAVIPPVLGYDARVAGQLGIAVFGLMLVEQVFRNSPASARWQIKFFLVGLGGILIFDVYHYASVLLLRQVDVEIWSARGYVSAVAAPLIAVAAFRSRNWRQPVRLSQGVIFYGTTTIAVGVYFLLMALGGYAIRYSGGEWGAAAQLIFFFGAVLVLAVVLLSGAMRARLKVFIGKHIRGYRYDYRSEWLRSIGLLSRQQSRLDLEENCIKVIADTVESAVGQLWMKDNGGYVPTAGWQLSEFDLPTQQPMDSMTEFLRTRQWIIDVHEVRMEPGLYQGMQLPAWLSAQPEMWLVVPLMHQAELLGFVVLGKPRTPIKLNWEDRDLLLTLGRQAASHLALSRANEALAESRQFEAYSRLSAYLVHDLKNVVAQLEMVTQNAKKHRENPAFIADTFKTIASVSTRMSRMLMQLKKAGVNPGGETSVIDVRPLLDRVVERRAVRAPVPVLEAERCSWQVRGDEHRLESVLEHVVENAQQATPAYGHVIVRCFIDGVDGCIEVIDTGCGMDEHFIRERLFKPFDTTKGNAGMGIGAHEARDYVLSLGGRVDVRSSLEVGTTFAIRLPMAGN